MPSFAREILTYINCSQSKATSDLRRVTGYQDFVDDAPLDLVLSRTKAA